ncbi:MAG: hypothetical protein ACLFQV_01660 [Vulcanimicrobiota bacterium]
MSTSYGRRTSDRERKSLQLQPPSQMKARIKSDKIEVIKGDSHEKVYEEAKNLQNQVDEIVERIMNFEQDKNINMDYGVPGVITVDNSELGIEGSLKFDPGTREVIDLKIKSDELGKITLKRKFSIVGKEKIEIQRTFTPEDGVFRMKNLVIDTEDGYMDYEQG